MKLDFEIDKITESIENSQTGEVYKTLVLPINMSDLQGINKKNNWLFDWKLEFSQHEHKIYKLVIEIEPNNIQGLISLEKDKGFILMNLLENAPFNIGKNKKYFWVACNLVAYGCKLSKECGFDGVLAFDSKTNLISHYENTLGAVKLGGSRMAIIEERANFLISKYFPEAEEKK